MKPIVIDKDGSIVAPTDWVAKSNKIIEELGNSVFAKLQDNDVPQVDDYGNPIPAKPKEKFYKNQIAPSLTPMQVANKLNRLLRIYRPLTLVEAKELDEEEFRQAYLCYCDIISYINEYLVYLPSKQGLCSFINISVDTYNQLLNEPAYSETFKSFEDSFVDANFTSAQAGIVDTKTTIAKLQSKEVGHSVTKANEFIRIENFNQIDKQQVLVALDKFDSMTKKLPTNKG